ncbi:hemagglutinin repeat-containing protein [Psychrobacter urativorans]|uniref:hemagglutinin repeat-containing protein n=1 Tax=Psychrobacter urativorans TaxID=45610 RepID=UPI001D11F72D|nr:hemagglutinin repeat-containing protein [Psychrobacter urativorans]
MNVGGTTTFDIGNDVNIKGGVINTNQAQGQILGDVNIESLQDTATYDSNHKNIGFTLDVDLKGAGSSVSLKGGKTDINADYKAVGQQSGIFTGDGGFDLEVGGKTTLIGGAITTTDAAVAAGRNNYTSLGGIETQDIENSSSHKGDAIQVGVSLGMTENKPQANSNGLGYGTDGDSDSSTTRAGITGIAGNSGITTDNREEYAGALENGFDATRVNEELGAQTQITQAFDQEQRKIKTELNAKEQKLRDEAEEALKNGDNRKATEKFAAANKVQKKSLLFDSITGAIYAPNINGIAGYTVKAASPYVASQIGEYYKTNEVLNDIDEGNRGERGSAGHILAHTVLGAAVSYATGNDALTGGISAGTGEATAPLLSKFLYDSSDPTKLTAEQKDTISAIAGIVGGTIGATTGSANDTANAAEISVVAVEDNWDEVGHYYMTYIAALEGGFSNANAQKIATAAWAPDTDSRNAMSYKSLAQSLMVAPFDVFRGDKRQERNQPTIHALGVDAGIPLYEQQERRDKLEENRTAARAKTVALFSKIAKAQEKGKPYNLTRDDENLLHISGDLYGHDNHSVGFPEGVGHLYPGAKQDNPNYKNTTANFKTYAENIRYAANWSNKGTRGTQSSDYKKLLNNIASTSDKATQIKYLKDYALTRHNVDNIPKPKEDGAFK